MNFRDNLFKVNEGDLEETIEEVRNRDQEMGKDIGKIQEVEEQDRVVVEEIPEAKRKEVVAEEVIIIRVENKL